MITQRDILIAFVFTQVEVVFLTLWLIILFPAIFSLSLAIQVGALVVLEVGLFIEHIISRIPGK